MRLTALPVRLLLLGLVTLTGGCLYRMPVQQGNFLNPDQVAQLEKGMTRPQVRFLLGTPMVPNGFNTDRWDYYYYVDPGRRWPSQTKRLTVHFKDDIVERFERSDPPPEPAVPAAGASAAPETAPASAAPATAQP